jgi:hypothetical protein
MPDKIAAWLAVAFGLFLSVAEIARNWGSWEYWPFWLIDYIAVALLLIGGIAALRGDTIGRWLAAAWGFTACMFYGSFFSHLHDVMNHTVTGADVAREPRLTIIIGILFGFALIGFALTLLPRARAARAL